MVTQLCIDPKTVSMYVHVSDCCCINIFKKKQTVAELKLI